MVAKATLFIPLDGRITSQNILVAPLDGSEAMEIVWPGVAATGNTYQVSTETLGQFFSAFPYLNTEIITAGATSIGPYMVQPTDTRILFNKTLSSPSFAVMPLANDMLYSQPVFFKDFKGDAFTDNITITFSSGELCDGESQVVINNAYGWTTINPYPGGGAWYLS
jgi:hypothetical protein